MVFSHGAGTDDHMFDPQVPVLASSYRVVTPYASLCKAMAQASAVTPETRAYLLDAFGRIGKTDFLRIWHGVAGCLHAEPGYHIPCPLLLTHGAADKTGNIRKIAPAWARREPACTYAVIPDAGHVAHHDNPAAFHQLLLAFLAALPRKRHGGV